MQNQHLTSKEYAFVTEILNGSTVEQAGEAVGIKRRSAFLWKSKQHIQAALEAGIQGEAKVVEEFRAERARVALPKVSSLLEEAAPRMVQILIELAEEAPNSATRLNAAKEVIRLSSIIEHTSYTEMTQRSLSQKKGLTSEEAAQIRSQILGIGPLE